MGLASDGPGTGSVQFFIPNPTVLIRIVVSSVPLVRPLETSFPIKGYWILNIEFAVESLITGKIQCFIITPGNI